MCRHTLRIASLAILAAAVCTACRAAPSSTAPTPFATPTAASLPSFLLSPATSIAPGPQLLPSPEPGAGLLVWLLWRHTQPKAYVRWGRIPDSALLAKGTVFYGDEGGPSELATRYSRLIPATPKPGAAPAPTPVAPYHQANSGASQFAIEEHPLRMGPMISHRVRCAWRSTDSQNSSREFRCVASAAGTS